MVIPGAGHVSNLERPRAVQRGGARVLPARTRRARRAPRGGCPECRGAVVRSPLRRPMSMEFRILGPLEVRARPRARARRRQAACAAGAAAPARQRGRLDRAADRRALGRRAAGDGRQELQVYVSRLRGSSATAGSCTRAPGYLLQGRPGRARPRPLRAARWQRRGGAGDPATAARELREALALWRGPPLADFAYEPFAQAEIARLEELRLAALEQRDRRRPGAGRHAELAGELEALVAEQPLRERLRGQLMLALYRSGRQAEALEAYQRARTALVERAGHRAGPRAARAATGDPRAGPGARAAAAGRSRPREAPRGAFVGRERELAELVAALDDALAGRGRLVPARRRARHRQEPPGRGADRPRARARRAGARRPLLGGGRRARLLAVGAVAARLRARERRRRAARRSSAPGRGPRADRPGAARALPRPAAAAGARVRGGALSPVRRDCGVPAQRGRAAGRSCSCSTICTRPTRRRCCCCGSSRASSARRAILVLGAYRDVDPVPGRPLTEMLAEVAREPVDPRALAGRAERARGRGVRRADGVGDRVAAAGRGAARGDRGQPAVRRRDRAPARGRGRRRESGRAGLAIPQSVRDVIARRLGHLSEECNRMLVLASVLGREFALDALARLGGVSEDELLDALDEAMAARVVADVPGAPGRLRFAHVLIRDTLYEGLTARPPGAAAQAAVEALEALYGDGPGPHLAELAHHAHRRRRLRQGPPLRAPRRRPRARAARLRGGGAPVRAGARGARPRATRPTSESDASCCSRSARRTSRAGETPAATGRPSSTPPRSRGASAWRASSPARRLGYGGRIVWARAGGDDGSCRCSRRGSPRSATRTSSCAPGCSPAWPARCATSRRATAATRSAARRWSSPAARGDRPRSRTRSTAARPPIAAPTRSQSASRSARELRDVAERIGDRERLVHGHLHRLTALLMVGDVGRGRGRPGRGEPRRRRAAAARAALGRPRRAGDARAGGRQARRGGGAHRRRAGVGERAQPEMAIPVYRLQRSTLCDFRGGVEEVEPEIRELVVALPGAPGLPLRCSRTLYARLGRPAEAGEPRRARADGSPRCRSTRSGSTA